MPAWLCNLIYIARSGYRRMAQDRPIRLVKGAYKEPPTKPSPKSDGCELRSAFKDSDRYIPCKWHKISNDGRLPIPQLHPTMKAHCFCSPMQREPSAKNGLNSKCLTASAGFTGIVGEGRLPVRVYVPFWHALVSIFRRRLERPANIWFFVQISLKKTEAVILMTASFL